MVPWRRSNSPGRSAAAQLLVGLGAKILLDLVEVFFHFGDGAGGQRDEAGQVSHVHDVDAAGPALQLLGRGVQRAAGGRRPVIPHTRCWNLAGGIAVVMG
jgi:hypothetical protein